MKRWPKDAAYAACITVGVFAGLFFGWAMTGLLGMNEVLDLASMMPADDPESPALDRRFNMLLLVIFGAGVGGAVLGWFLARLVDRGQSERSP